MQNDLPSDWHLYSDEERFRWLHGEINRLRNNLSVRSRAHLELSERVDKLERAFVNMHARRGNRKQTEFQKAMAQLSRNTDDGLDDPPTFI